MVVRQPWRASFYRQYEWLGRKGAPRYCCEAVVVVVEVEVVTGWAPRRPHTTTRRRLHSPAHWGLHRELWVRLRCSRALLRSRCCSQVAPTVAWRVLVSPGLADHRGKVLREFYMVSSAREGPPLLRKASKVRRREVLMSFIVTNCARLPHSPS